MDSNCKYKTHTVLTNLHLFYYREEFYFFLLILPDACIKESILTPFLLIFWEMKINLQPKAMLMYALTCSFNAFARLVKCHDLNVCAKKLHLNPDILLLLLEFLCIDVNYAPAWLILCFPWYFLPLFMCSVGLELYPFHIWLGW